MAPSNYWNVRCPSCLNTLGIAKSLPTHAAFCDEFCAEDHRLGALEERDALIEHLSTFLSPSEIAARFNQDGLSRQAVASVLRRRRLG